MKATGTCPECGDLVDLIPRSGTKPGWLVDTHGKPECSGTYNPPKGEIKILEGADQTALSASQEAAH